MVNKDILQDKRFTSAIVFEIELLNGKQSALTTIYDSQEVNFEEVVKYMEMALANCQPVKSVRSNVGTVRTGQFQAHIIYGKTEFDRTEILKNPFIKRHYGL